METSLPPNVSPSRAARWSWALVIACGLLLGFYLLQTYGKPQVRQYQLDFGQAQWIEPSESHAPVAYFRKEVYLSAIPEQAWLQIAASDNFGLLVNGHTLGDLTSVKTFETGIYDLKKALKLGVNVIAVSVSRTSYPGRAQLLIRGEITEPGQQVISVLSDETWRASNRTGIIGGEMEWTSPKVEDQIWPHARRSALNDQHVPLRWVDTNPLLLQLPRVGSWIMPENAAHEAVFSTVIKADRPKEETWIQVASSGDLDLVINGHILATAGSSPTSSKRLPHLPTETSTPSPLNARGKVANTSEPASKVKGSPFLSVTLQTYDISHWMKRGPNVLIATVRSDQVPASLFLTGFLVKSQADVVRFATSAAWHLGENPSSEQAMGRQRLIESGKDGVAPWGYLSQELARPQDYSGFAALFRSWAIVSLTLAAVIAMWWVTSVIVSRWRDQPLAYSMARDALLHGPVAVALLLMQLPNYDPRFPGDWSFQPKFVVGALAILLLLRLLHLFPDSWTPAFFETTRDRMRVKAAPVLARLRRLISHGLRLPEFFEIPFRQLLPYLLLALIMFLGLGLRYHSLGDMSFDHDEMGVITKSKGIYTLGIPYTVFAGEVRWMTTYEAIPYPLAFSGFLFDYSEWSMRLPACIFGTLTIGLIGLMGRRLFNWRTGLFAALVYACLPLNIRWGQNAFYLSQCQFLALLTMWLFYESIRVRPLNRNFMTGATVAFCFCYLSWEGTAFLLPALIMGLLIVRWGEWWWLKEFHLYRCLFFIGALVVAQYCSRMLAGVPYLQVGSGLSNLTGPSLFFLAPGYQPMFYVDKLLLSENHVFFTLMLLLGLPFCWKSPGFRYVVVLLATLFVLHTNFLAALSPRYCYYFQPLVIMGGVAAAIMLYDRMMDLARAPGDSMVARYAAHATGLCLLLLLFLQSNESVMKEYQLSSTGDTPQMMSRLNTYRYDYRGAADFVMAHARPGDVILPGIPHVFNFYTGTPGDYFLDTLFSSKVPYNQLLAEPRFIDKFAGLPVIRNLTEFKDVLHRSGRAWIIFAPYASFEKLNNPEVVNYVHENAKTQFESYRAKVFLFEGAQTAAAVAQAP